MSNQSTSLNWRTASSESEKGIITVTCGAASKENQTARFLSPRFCRIFKLVWGYQSPALRLLIFVFYCFHFKKKTSTEKLISRNTCTKNLFNGTITIPIPIPFPSDITAQSSNTELLVKHTKEEKTINFYTMRFGCVLGPQRRVFFILSFKFFSFRFIWFFFQLLFYVLLSLLFKLCVSVCLSLYFLRFFCGKCRKPNLRYTLVYGLYTTDDSTYKILRKTNTFHCNEIVQKPKDSVRTFPFQSIEIANFFRGES